MEESRIEKIRMDTLLAQQIREIEISEFLSGPAVSATVVDAKAPEDVEEVPPVSLSLINPSELAKITASVTNGGSPTPNWSFSRIAQVIRADLDILGQLRPGSKISFTLVTESDAEKFWHDKLKIISTISLQLRTASGLFL
jgi:hypothetical protein